MTRIFTIPANLPFLPTLAHALLDGRLVPGFPGEDPLALADAVVYLPTQRAARAFGQALVAASGAKTSRCRASCRSARSPSEEDEAAIRRRRRSTSARRRRPRTADDARPARRRLGRALKGAIRRMGADGRLEIDAREPPLVAATPAQALRLAGDLAALIDDMRIEGVAFERLDSAGRRRFRPLLAHHPRFPQDRLRGLAGLARRDAASSTAPSARSARSSARSPRLPTARADDRRRLDRHQRRHGAADRRRRARRQRRRRARRPRRRSRRGRLAADRRKRRSRPPPPIRRRRWRGCCGRIGAARDDVQPARRRRRPARAFSPRRCGRPNRRISGAQRATSTPAAALAGVALVEAEQRGRGGARRRARAARDAGDARPHGGAGDARSRDRPPRRRRTRALGRRGRELRRGDARRDRRTASSRGSPLAAAREFAPAASRRCCGSPRAAARPRRRGIRGGRARARSRRAARAAAAERRSTTPTRRCGGARAPPHPLTRIARSRRSATTDFAAAAGAARRSRRRARRPCGRADGGPLAGLIAAHAQALARARRAGEPIGEAVADLLDEWALAAGDGFALRPRRLRRRCSRRWSPSARRRARAAIPASRSSACWRRGCSISTASCSPGSTRPCGRRRRAPTRSSTGRCARDLGLSPPERRIGQTAQDFVAALGAADAVV